ncbi:MAG TPA: gluconeogenesis factor YvcK family protein [Acidimicrobiales bacterium]|nr:gluconeogenesis factor YvcK family protein [Acidimicrobiales bacterium]
MTDRATNEPFFFAPLVRGGPSVVAIGGGHGLARTLGALRRYAGEITAVVSVADDGGSSGRLREAFGIPAPGDIRRCIGALLPGRSPLGEALEYRFKQGELGGHAFGNLFLAALAAMTGDFVSGVAECCAVLETVGAVVPATADPVVLKATVDGNEMRGQARIKMTAGVTSVALVPDDAPVPKAAVAALERADQIVIGPGSLYTSILAALAPRPIAAAIARSDALLIYVCNLREQVPETSGYDVTDHVAALVSHGITPDVVVCDSGALVLSAIPDEMRVVDRTLSDASGTAHDEDLLAEALLEAART